MTEGLQVAVIGLAVVFTFLATLVLSVYALGWAVTRWSGPAASTGRTDRKQSSGLETSRVAAAVAAIAVHRRRGSAER